MLSLTRVLLLVFTFSFIFAQKAFAAISLSISDVPSQINVEDSFTAKIKMEGAQSDSEYYIRGSFFHPDANSNYFGFTKNNDGNLNNTPSQYTSYFKIIGNGEWSIEFKADKDSSAYKGPNSYQFKIGRYVPSGGLTWSDQIATIQLTSSQTPTPTPTPSLTPTPTQASQTPQIELSEVMACPNSGESEWVELKNGSNFEAQLNNWKIRDSASYEKTFSLTIGLGNFASVDVGSLNNDGDSVKLYDQNDQLISSMSYASCDNGLSWINSGGTWTKTTTPTKNSGNQSNQPTSPPATATPTPKPTDSTQPTSTPKPSTTPTPKPTTTGTPTSSQSARPLPSLGRETGDVLGADIEDVLASPTTESDTEKTSLNQNSQRNGIISILIGSVLFVGVGGYFVSQWYNKSTQLE